MDNKCPDYYESPEEQGAKIAHKLFLEAHKKHKRVLAEATSWQVAWEQIAQNPESPEEESMPDAYLQKCLMMKFEYILLEILAELKKMNKK